MRSLVLVSGLLALSAAASAQEEVPSQETAAAREQARLCERLNLAAGADACRSALALGISAARRPALRDQLARHLVALEDWGALADHYREGVRLSPGDATAWRRLGETLLFALDERQEATSALAEAVRLAPEDAESRLGLAQAQLATGRTAEARATFAAALALDPHVLDGRPAARAAMDAARAGKGWP